MLHAVMLVLSQIPGQLCASSVTSWAQALPGQVPPSQGYLPRPDIMSDSYRPAEKNNFRQLSATDQVARLQARAEDQETKLHFDMVCY